VNPEQLSGWQPYHAATAPAGLNKTVWLKNTLPALTDERQVLYFANGLEDVAVYIDGKLVYSYGSFRKAWDEVSPQRWHAIPLSTEHSHKPVIIRTHYALSYVLRTLYPVIRPHADALSSHTSQSFPLIYIAGWFGLLGTMVLAVAFLRRQFDLFLYFGLMAISVSSWILFNQDSVVKPYTGLPPRSWSYFDLIGIYLSGACLISFLSIIAQSKSRLIRFVFWMNWGMAATVAAVSGLGGIHGWYLLPLLHIAVFPSLLALIPLIIWSAVHRNWEARILMVGSLAIALSAIHDIVRYSSSFKSPITTMIPFGGLVMLMAMLMILIRRYQAEREEAFQTQARLLADIQKLNAQLQVHVEKVEALVDEKTQEIGSIMAHIQQGIFMLTGSELTIHPEYSEHLETILGVRKLAGKSFEFIFLNKCRLSTDEKSRIKSALQASLGEDRVSFEVNSTNFPTEVWFQGESEKILELAWAPVTDEHNTTDKILITARDVTGLRQLQMVAQRNQEELQLLSILLSASPDRFARFLEYSFQLFHRAHRSLNQTGDEALRSVFRDLHTLKGNARAYSLDELSSLIHDAEILLQKRLKSITSEDSADLEALFQEIESRLTNYQDLFQKYRPIQTTGDPLKLDRRALIEVLQDRKNKESERLKKLESLLLPGVFVSFEDLRFNLSLGLERIARDLDKETPELMLEGAGLYLKPSTADLLADCIGHLLRNAMDHGLEKPQERIAAGKPAHGCIALIARPSGHELRITFTDDGQGLDMKKIRDKAQARALIQPHENLTESNLERLLFSPGFSTKSEASIISGRGVGLDAVRSALEREQGRIHLQFTEKDDQRGTWHFHFEIFLPASTYVIGPESQLTTLDQRRTS
jgi:HPt (histidine-containing phosphotransfer) domain-containing protein